MTDARTSVAERAPERAADQKQVGAAKSRGATKSRGTTKFGVPFRRRPLLLAISVTAVAAVVAGGFAFASSHSDKVTNAPTNLPSTDAAKAIADQPAKGAPVPATGAPAPDPATAVQRFVVAEVAGDRATSFSLLGPDDRARYRSVAAWTAAHASLPAITGVTLSSSQPTPIGAAAATAVAAPTSASSNDPAAATSPAVDVEGDVTFTPSLDEVIGLTPPGAAAHWVVVAENGGWRVDFGRSTFAPSYASETGAAPAVLAWAESRQRCASAEALAALQYADGLRGSPALAGALCKASGTVSVSGPRRLDATAATPILAAFGPDADTWARVIDVGGPVPLRVVVAPVGARWLVIGVLSGVPELGH